jgi:hypothetical protein
MNTITTTLYQQTLDELLKIGSLHLYSINPTPIIYCSEDDRGCNVQIKHTFNFRNYQYGKAIFIICICSNCGFGEIEVLPPHQKGEKE